MLMILSIVGFCNLISFADFRDSVRFLIVIPGEPVIDVDHNLAWNCWIRNPECRFHVVTKVASDFRIVWVVHCLIIFHGFALDHGPE